MVNLSSYCHLTQFICHLFIDGRFRTAHFLYKPNTFDFDLLQQIDRLCSEPMQIYLTDITLPLEWPWNDNDNTENVLQLSILDPGDFEEDISQIEFYAVAYYQVFGFYSNDQFDCEEISSIFQVLTSQSDEMNSQILLVQYDERFGDLERMQPIAVQRTDPALAFEHGLKTDYVLTLEIVWMHHYHLQLNNSFINMTWVDDEDSFTQTKHCVLQSSHHYKELFYEYHCTANGNS